MQVEFANTQYKSNGFSPLFEEFDSTKVKRNNINVDKYDFDPLKIHYINSFIDSVKDVKMIFVVSPVWYGLDCKRLAPLIDICKMKNIELIDFSNNPKYVNNDFYFQNGTHLNAIGADEFTRDLMKNVLDVIKN